MIRATLRGSAASARSARAIGPLSGCERYSTPAGERYCTDCAAAGIAPTTTIATNAVTRPRLPEPQSLNPSTLNPPTLNSKLSPLDCLIPFLPVRGQLNIE